MLFLFSFIPFSFFSCLFSLPAPLSPFFLFFLKRGQPAHTARPARDTPASLQNGRQFRQVFLQVTKVWLSFEARLAARQKERDTSCALSCVWRSERAWCCGWLPPALEELGRRELQLCLDWQAASAPTQRVAVSRTECSASPRGPCALRDTLGHPLSSMPQRSLQRMWLCQGQLSMRTDNIKAGSSSHEPHSDSRDWPLLPFQLVECG